MTKNWFAPIAVTLTVTACGGSGTPALQGRAPKDAGPQRVRLPAGTVFTVRLDRALSTARNRSGDPFVAVLDQPIAVDGTDVLPVRTRFTGHVIVSRSSGRLEGRGVLDITLDGFDLSGQHYPVVTSVDSRATEAHKKRNLELIGGGAGLGAVVGGLTGGGKGAAIGAGVGAAGGAGVAATTGKKNVDVAAETVFRFSLKHPVDVAH